MPGQQRQVRFLPRLLRLRDAPFYVGMDRNRFNAEVRPHLTEIPIGEQGIAFDRVELVAWVDHYKSRNGRPGQPKGAKSWDANPHRASSSDRGGWHIDKVMYGQRIVESTRTGNRQEAERYLAHRIETLRQTTVYGVRPTRLVKEAAAKYLRENLHKRSIADDASRLKRILPFIGELPLQRIHDGTLAPYVEACRKRGLKTKTVNNGIEVVRRLLNLAARKWRDEHGLTWLETPPLLSMVEVTDARPPYPLNWDEQQYLLKALPDHLATMALFKVNTGCREQEVCQLRWDWEVAVPELETPVFLIPPAIVKNKEDRLVVLNAVAKSVIQGRRGKHKTHVFTYRGRPLTRIYNSGWKLAREQAAARYAEDHDEPVTWGFANLRVHDLKHTFGRRLRAVGVPLETRKVLLGHRNGDITSHYSAPEIEELLEAANRVCAVQSR